MSTPNKRLSKILAQLKASGISQREIAKKIDTPAQYISDIKAGRSTLTSTFALRLERSFGVSHDWLLKEEGEPWIAEAAKDDYPPFGQSTEVEALPLLDTVVGDNPSRSSDWNGARYPVFAAQARPSLADAYRYVLRVSEGNACEELKPGDLVLVENRPAITLKSASDRLCAVRVGDVNTLDTVTPCSRPPGYRLRRLGDAARRPDAEEQEIHILGICVSLLWRKLS